MKNQGAGEQSQRHEFGFGMFVEIMPDNVKKQEENAETYIRNHKEVMTNISRIKNKVSEPSKN